MTWLEALDAQHLQAWCVPDVHVTHLWCGECVLERGGLEKVGQKACGRDCAAFGGGAEEASSDLLALQPCLARWYMALLPMAPSPTTIAS